MIEPNYQELPSEDIKRAEKDGVKVQVTTDEEQPARWGDPHTFTKNNQKEPRRQGCRGNKKIWTAHTLGASTDGTHHNLEKGGCTTLEGDQDFNLKSQNFPLSLSKPSRLCSFRRRPQQCTLCSDSPFKDVRFFDDIRIFDAAFSDSLLRVVIRVLI